MNRRTQGEIDREVERIRSYHRKVRRVIVIVTILVALWMIFTTGIIVFSD